MIQATLAEEIIALDRVMAWNANIISARALIAPSYDVRVSLLAAVFSWRLVA